MVNSHSSTPKPKGLTAPKKTLAQVVSTSDAAGLEHKIRERAHQLYEGRGREPGRDQQDWVQAEHEISKERP
ncbi:MAG: DUF2934 domain-containing protein [Acidobacteriia bacterium]|nr:DUF2934 domain-containing protein [Terriglobia bacterium]